MGFKTWKEREAVNEAHFLFCFKISPEILSLGGLDFFPMNDEARRVSKRTMLPECHCEWPERREGSLGLLVQKSQLGSQLPKDWGGRCSGKRKVHIKNVGL